MWGSTLTNSVCDSTAPSIPLLPAAPQNYKAKLTREKDSLPTAGGPAPSTTAAGGFPAGGASLSTDPFFQQGGLGAELLRQLGQGGGGSGNVFASSLLGVRTEHPVADNGNCGEEDEGRPAKIQRRPSPSVLDLQTGGGAAGVLGLDLSRGSDLQQLPNQGTGAGATDGGAEGLLRLLGGGGGGGGAQSTSGGGGLHGLRNLDAAIAQMRVQQTAGGAPVDAALSSSSSTFSLLSSLFPSQGLGRTLGGASGIDAVVSASSGAPSSSLSSTMQGLMQQLVQAQKAAEQPPQWSVTAGAGGGMGLLGAAAEVEGGGAPRARTLDLGGGFDTGAGGSGLYRRGVDVPPAGGVSDLATSRRRSSSAGVGLDLSARLPLQEATPPAPTFSLQTAAPAVLELGSSAHQDSAPALGPVTATVAVTRAQAMVLDLGSTAGGALSTDPAPMTHALVDSEAVPSELAQDDGGSAAPFVLALGPSTVGVEPVDAENSAGEEPTTGKDISSVTPAPHEAMDAEDGPPDAMEE